MLHYSTLSTMLWIAVTARNIYKQVTKKTPPCPGADQQPYAQQPLLRYPSSAPPAVKAPALHLQPALQSGSQGNLGPKDDAIHTGGQGWAGCWGKGCRGRCAEGGVQREGAEGGVQREGAGAAAGLQSEGARVPLQHC